MVLLIQKFLCEDKGLLQPGLHAVPGAAPVGSSSSNAIASSFLFCFSTHLAMFLLQKPAEELRISLGLRLNPALVCSVKLEKIKQTDP